MLWTILDSTRWSTLCPRHIELCFCSQPFLDTQLQTQLLDLHLHGWKLCFQSAIETWRETLRRQLLHCFKRFLKTWEIQDNFKTLTPFYVECIWLCSIGLIKQNGIEAPKNRWVWPRNATSIDHKLTMTPEGKIQRTLTATRQHN